MNASNNQSARPSLSSRFAASVPRGYEWLFWGWLALLQGYMIERSEGHLVDRLADNLVGFGAMVVIFGLWTVIAPSVRAEQQLAASQTRYKSWWIPRSLKMRALSALAFAALVLLFIYQVDSVRSALVGLAVLLSLIGVGVMMGATSNYVELGADAISVNWVLGGGIAWRFKSSSIPYRNIETIHLKKNGDFDLQYLDDNDAETRKRMHVQIVPEQRHQFLDDLRSRIEAVRSEALNILMDRDP